MLNIFLIFQVKNKAPAEIQITAEQLLREAKERDLEILPPPPKQKISDPEELRDYQHRKRKAFEDNIRKNRQVRYKFSYLMIYYISQSNSIETIIAKNCPLESGISLILMSYI